MSDDNEEWRPIAGFEGYYEVSSFGRVRSLDRNVTQEGYTRRLRGKILRSRIGNGGYEGVQLKNQTKERIVRVHRLVAETFLGPPESDDLHVCHFDGDPKNNRVENLRWDTTSANQLDRVRHGRHNHAGKTHCHRGHALTDENVAIQDRTRQGRRKERVCLECRRIAQTKSEERRLRALNNLRAEFLRLLTVDGDTDDRRRSDYNQAIFDAERGFAIFTSTDLDMVMDKFDRALAKVKKTA